MAIQIQLQSTNYNGQLADITYYPCSGGTISLGYQTIPFTYTNDNYEGTYDLFFSAFSQTCQLVITCPTPTPTTTTTPTVTPTPTLTTTPTITPTLTQTPTPSPGPAFDADAAAYLSAVDIAGGTTNPTISAATDTLFTSLKSNGLYTKLKVFYPFVGATANSTALMGKRVSGTTYDLTYNGGWTFNSSGATPNGTTGYANTSYPPNLEGQNNIHMSVYNTQESTGSRVEMGSTSAGSDIQIVSNFGANNYSAVNNGGQGGGPVTSSGFIVISRTGSTNFNYFLNGSKTIKSQSSVPPNSFNVYIACRNNSGTPEYYDTKQKAFASIGSGLSDTDVANLTAIINTFQTSLGRNV
jgi:hypothetical protein